MEPRRCEACTKAAIRVSKDDQTVESRCHRHHEVSAGVHDSKAGDHGELRHAIIETALFRISGVFAHPSRQSCHDLSQSSITELQRHQAQRQSPLQLPGLLRSRGFYV